MIRPAYLALTVLIAVFCALTAIAALNGHGGHGRDDEPHARVA